MRLLHVVHNLAGEHVGGTERYTLQLLAALAARGHDVEAFTTRTGGSFALRRSTREEIPVAVLDQPRATSFRERSRIQAEVADRLEAHAREAGTEILHVQHLIDVSPFALTLPRRLGVPGVVSLHDFWYRCPRTTLLRKDGTVCHTGPRGGVACVRFCRPAATRADHADTPGGRGPVRPRDLAYVVRERRMRRLLAGVDRFVAASSFTRNTYARLGVDPSRIEVIPWGLPDPAAPRTPRRTARPVRIVFLGNLSPAKGADIAIEAFSRVDPALATLSMHGPIDGPQEGRFRALLLATPRIRWDGPYGRDELDAILGEADAVVMPSRALENYPLVVQEAFQRGVPVVASAAGALPELVRDGGVVFGHTAEDLRGQVERLAQERSVLDRLAAAVPPVKPMAAHAAEIEALYERLRSATREPAR